MNKCIAACALSIIHTNHYIYSIIFIMNYLPAWSIDNQTDILGCEYTQGQAVDFYLFITFFTVANGLAF